jgi:hypothetical protein
VNQERAERIWNRVGWCLAIATAVYLAYLIHGLHQITTSFGPMD